MLVARRVYWASLEAGLAPGRTGLVADLFRRGLRCVGCVKVFGQFLCCDLGRSACLLFPCLGWGLVSQ